MSRRIEPKASVTLSEEETELRRKDCGRLILTSYQKQNCALLIQNDRLTEAAFFPAKPSMVGAIYIGKVKNVVKNIDACFVEIADKELCFLPIKNISESFLLNRRHDGRILEGDELLVQVVRDAQKSKRASVTTQISVSNDYFVMTLGSGKVCYSSKLNRKQKDYLEKLLSERGILNPLEKGFLSQECSSLLQDGAQAMVEGMAVSGFRLPPTKVIVRTKAGEECSAEELLAHFYELSTEYIRILYIAMYRSCFSCLKEAETGVESIMRQFPEIRSCPAPNQENVMEDGFSWEIVTDMEPMYAQLCKYREEHGLNAQVRLYKDALSLSTLYSIESKLRTALDSHVWLKSGGYLVIEPTEALTVIDVNTGKYEAGKDAAETYLKINLEAAREVALQLRLRNLSGIIIVDFINMRSAEDNAQLMALLKDLIRQDKVKASVIDMTPLGLVEITRTKINKPLKEQLMRADMRREG